MAVWMPKWLRTSTLDAMHTARRGAGGVKKTSTAAAIAGGIILVLLLVASNFTGSRSEHREVLLRTDFHDDGASDERLVVSGSNHHSLKQDPSQGADSGASADAPKEPPAAPQNLTLHQLRDMLDTIRRRQRAPNDQSSLVPPVSIIAACRNRLLDAEVSVQTWLRAKGVGEIVLVDWGSVRFGSSHLEKSFHDLARRTGTLGRKLVLVHVDAQRDFVASKAYNLAASVARGQWILKVDCDTLLSHSFLDEHPILDGRFYALGTPRNENEARLHGVFFGSRTDFLAARGYDERIVHYGWEDRELVQRLSHLDQHHLNADFISHMPHADPAEAADVASIRTVSVQVNKELLETVPKWSEVAKDGNTTKYVFQVLGNVSNEWWIQAQMERDIERLEDAVGDEGWEQAVRRATQRVLHDSYNVPYDVLLDFAGSDLNDLLLLVYAATLPRPRRLLFMNAGRSVVSIFSAVAAAAEMDRPLIVTWGGDEGAGSMADLWDLAQTNANIAMDTQAGTTFTVLFNMDSWKCSDPSLEECAQRDPAYNKVEVHVPGMGQLRDPPLQHIYLQASVENPFIFETDRTAKVSSLESKLRQRAVEDVEMEEAQGVVKLKEDEEPETSEAVVDIGFVLRRWLIPSGQVRRMLRSFKDYVGATCVMGQRGIAKLAKEKDTVIGDVFVFGTESHEKIDWLGKEVRIVGGACVGAPHCTQRRIADHYAILMCARVLDDSEVVDGDPNLRKLWEQYEPWRKAGRFHFDVK